MAFRTAAIIILALFLGSCATQAPQQTEILWDTWGVPHIYGKDVPDLFYAFGWAQTASHGDLLLRLYGQARGKASEYWGEESLESDRWVRTVGLPDRARAWYQGQSPEFRESLDAFADGINAYAREHPDLIADDVEVVLPVDGVDVLAHAQRVIHFTFVTGPQAVSMADAHLSPGSNAWAIAPSRTADGHAMLLMNPHLPWGDLFLFYEADLHAPGIDMYGSTLLGFPVLILAFNDNLAWTHTVNTIDAADLYELTLVEDGYRFDGQVRALDERMETIRIKEPDGAMRDEPHSVQSSVHGPVIGEREGAAVALRVAGLDAPGMLEQWWEMGRAQDLGEFEAALRRQQIPMFTVMYADREGHILHTFGGQVPVRSSGDWDYWSGVVPGDTSDTLWTTVHSYDDLPRVLDPETGWLQNANDPPWTTTFPLALDPDKFPSYMAPRSMWFRPQRSARMLAEDDQVTFDELIAYKHSTRMELADRILDDLLPAAHEFGGPLAQRAAEVLESWDRTADAESRGSVLFAEWLKRSTFDGMFATEWNWDAPRTTPDGLADPRQAVRDLEEAAQAVEADHGALDVAWGDLHRLQVGGHDLPASGGPGYPFGIFRVLGFEPMDDGRLAANFGDSFVAAVEFAEPVRARVLMSYGNATQPGSPHVGDQLELLARQETREAWLTRVDIEAHLESRELLIPGEQK